MFSLTEITNQLLKVGDAAILAELLLQKNELVAQKTELTAIKNSVARSNEFSSISYTDTFFAGKTAATGYYFGATAGGMTTAIPLDVGIKKRKTIRIKNNYSSVITINVYAKKTALANAANFRDILLGEATTIAVGVGEELFFDSNDYPILETAFPGLLIRIGMSSSPAMVGNVELDIMAGV